MPARAVEELAHAALTAMGVNVKRYWGGSDRAAACAFVARHALEELEELGQEDQRVLWEVVRYLATHGNDELAG